MLYPLIAVLLLLVIAVALVPLPHPDRAGRHRPLLRAAPIAAVLLALATLGFSIARISPGNTGIIYQLGTSGDIVGTLDSGVQLKLPWRGVREVNTRTQVVSSERLVGFSKESQDIFLDVAVNFNVQRAQVKQLYSTVGPTFKDVLIVNRVSNAVKTWTVLYPIEQVAPNREQIRRQVQEQLEGELGPFGIEVSSVQITNIDFDPAFKQSILAKQTATQEAQRAEQIVAQREAEARQRAAQAEGEAQATKINASAQAQANREIGQSITPELVEYQRAQALVKLAENDRVQILPPGLLFDASKVTGTTTTTPATP